MIINYRCFFFFVPVQLYIALIRRVTEVRIGDDIDLTDSVCDNIAKQASSDHGDTDDSDNDLVSAAATVSGDRS
uniref:Secreted protein n=1 Tax=Setaria digitata TaxID=48799 RepID=A0A915Q1D6_9BILA